MTLQVIVSIFLFAASSFAQTDTILTVQHFSTLPSLSIRALEVVGENKVWFAANHGTWGYTEDSGKSWHIDSIKVDTIFPEFRSIAVLNDSTVLLLSTAFPAFLFKTTNKGKTWRSVYRNFDKNIFFDSMLFFDQSRGMAVADPLDGHFYFLSTMNGGDSWTMEGGHAFSNSYSAQGEAFFAASNSNIAFHNEHVWFATGGTQARVLSPVTVDGQGKFLSYSTPIAQGSKMSGIFSMDFINDSIGLIGGGNYEKTDASITSLAITNNGGVTWKSIKSTKPFFVSCVQFRNSGNDFMTTGHDGTFLGNYTTEKAREIKDANGKSLKFHTLRFSPSGKKVWLAGSKGEIAFIELNK